MDNEIIENKINPLEITLKGKLFNYTCSYDKLSIGDCNMFQIFKTKNCYISSSCCCDISIGSRVGMDICHKKERTI